MADFRPALIVVDFQEDFCPPNGSLAVQNGRDITPVVNKLLSLPFAIKVATKDWHPQSHISFASNHKDKQPFVDDIVIANPANPDETYTSRLWPVHCVQNTAGAELVPELDVSKVDQVINKGTDERVEMYSPFYDPFEQPRGCASGLKDLLKSRGITDVYVVGLAADYCVKNCAVDAAREGFNTFIVEEGTRAVDPGAWPSCRDEIGRLGVRVVSMEGHEVKRMMAAS